MRIAGEPCGVCGQVVLNCKCATGGIVNSMHLTMIGRESIERVIPLGMHNEIFNNDHMFINVDKNSIKGRIFEYFNKQTEKGVQKYGHTLDDCPDEKFDWRLMIIEELVDCIQYQQKEIIRLERLLNPADETN